MTVTDNAAESRTTAATTLGAAIAAACAAAPARVICRCYGENGERADLAGADVDRMARRFAAWYAARGLRPGAIVVILLTHRPELLHAQAGALYAGLVPCLYAPPSFKFPAAAYAAMVRDLLAGAGAALLLTERAVANHLPLADIACPACCLEEVVLPEQQPDPLAVAPDAPALLQYSSGTTGLKKGVVLSHRTVLRQLALYGKAIGITARDTVVSWLPLYHDMGLIACWLLPLTAGAELVWLSPFAWVRDPALLLRAVTEHRGTLLWLPNFAFSFLAERVPAAAVPGYDLSSLRLVTSCAEVVRAESVDAFYAHFAPAGLRAATFAACYAMAEATFAVACTPRGEAVRRECVDARELAASGRAVPLAAGAPGGRVLLSSGKPLPGFAVRAVLPDGSEAPERVTGELQVRGGTLFGGYHRSPAATAAAWDGEWYRTGDAGYRVGDEWFVTGRVRDLIIVAGVNIFPDDVEQAAGAVPGAKAGRCAAFGLADARRGTEELVVLVEPAPDWQGSDAELKQRVGAAVGGLLDIAPRVEVVPPGWLVKATSGKIARGASRDRFLAERAAATAAADETLAALCRVAEQILAERGRAERIAPDTPLLSSGLLDSFAFARLLAVGEERLGVALGAQQLRDIARCDTIAGLLALARGAPAADAGLPTTATPATAMPAPALPPLNLRTLWYRLLFAWRGIACGRDLRVLGPVRVRSARRGAVRFGDGVVLHPGAAVAAQGTGRITVGDRVAVLPGARLTALDGGTIMLGDDCHVGPYSLCTATAELAIGAGTMLAGFVSIITATHGTAAGSPLRAQPRTHGAIRVGREAWLGSHATLLPGTEVGDGAVVGANSLAGGKIPPDALVLGVPARVTGFRRPPAAGR